MIKTSHTLGNYRIHLTWEAFDGCAQVVSARTDDGRTLNASRVCRLLGSEYHLTNLRVARGDAGLRVAS